MRIIIRSVIVFGFMLLIVSASVAQLPSTYVNPLIGTGGHGHTFPGVTRPFGMVQLSPDTRLTGWDGCSGYHYSDNIIYGFSHTHLSGTGIPDYADILLMPTTGAVVFDSLVNGKTERGYASTFSHANEKAALGYYRVKLDDGGITAEITATDRVGLHRYTFPTDQPANIILDLTHRDTVLDSYLRIVDSTHIEGYRRSNSWAKDQIVYFAAEFSEPFKSLIALDGALDPKLREARGNNVKAAFTFAPRNGEIMVKLAISAVSIDGARANLAAELKDWDFRRVVSECEAAWNKEFGKIVITGNDDRERTNFYTALYHTMIAPNLFMDVDGKFRGRDGQVHTAKGFTNYSVFSLWDTFRAAHPLYTIIDQERTSDFIKTFLAQYEFGGRLPVWELAGNETDTMIGYHAVSVIADAAVKGIDGFDSEKAFVAMKQSANRRQPGLDSYRTHGFISMEDERESVSKTLEYSYDDWCIAQMAGLLGKQDDYEAFNKRAQFYQNAIDSETGFARPRANGGWLKPFDPRQVDFNFTEANSWQYTFFVPHDITGLMELLGGKDKFAQKLDQLFAGESTTTGRQQADITGLIGQYAHGNEPSHHMAYLYDYVGQPWKTQARLRQIMDKFYAPEPDGLIGNEDCGQMSAWYVLSAAGLYPVTPGRPLYAIGTPLFPELRFNFENGKHFVIKARAVSSQNIYIQSATLNGKPYRHSYLLHKDLMKGGELVFEMGPQPNQSWGSGNADIPTSQLSGKRIPAAPVIESTANTFKNELEVRIKNFDKLLRTRFTTDGSEPTDNSSSYDQPLRLKETSVIKAYAVDDAGRKSPVTSAVFHKIPHNWSIRVESHYSPQYAAGGELALIDGIRGNSNFSTGAWQGYQGQDFSAVIDLGHETTITKIGAGFLQDAGSWIWLPRRLEVEVSLDGKNFKPVLNVDHQVSDRESRVILKELAGNISPQLVRFVRLKAVGYGRIPDWHPGKGSESWIFIDEILIE